MIALCNLEFQAINLAVLLAINHWFFVLGPVIHCQLLFGPVERYVECVSQAGT